MAAISVISFDNRSEKSTIAGRLQKKHLADLTSMELIPGDKARELV